jgi:LuxR family quorum-sensing system transcriptional regulator SolR
MMKSWQISQLRQISAVETSEETFGIVRTEASRIGFEYCSFGMKAPVPVAAPRATWCSNYPLSWQKRYNDMGYIRRDPTVAHALVSDDAIVWSDQVFAPCPEMRHEARDHGLVHGWAQPRRDAHGMVSLLTLARKEPPISASEEAEKSERLKWLSFVCHEGMLKVWGDLLQDRLESQLSGREIEVLRWTCDGKTSEDIAQILGLSEATVNFHVRNACAKLGTSNKTAATVRAALMGLLW